jgi:hypothetical protein
MADLNQLNDLHLEVRSRILQQIQASLAEKGGEVASTQYTKSDGTNYGMYQKGDGNLLDVWDAVINQRAGLAALQNVRTPTQLPGAGG